MSTEADIVDRLRGYEAQDMAAGNAATIESLMNQAATEIERLRKQVKQLEFSLDAAEMESDYRTYDDKLA